MTDALSNLEVKLSKRVSVPGFDRVNPKSGKIEHVDAYSYVRSDAHLDSLPVGAYVTGDGELDSVYKKLGHRRWGDVVYFPLEVPQSALHPEMRRGEPPPPHPRIQAYSTGSRPSSGRTAVGSTGSRPSSGRTAVGSRTCSARASLRASSRRRAYVTRMPGTPDSTEAEVAVSILFLALLIIFAAVLLGIFVHPILLILVIAGVLLWMYRGPSART